MKYVISGIAANDNFGVLSLINGACTFIWHLDKQAEVIYIEKNVLNDVTLQSLEKANVTICRIDSDIKALCDALLVRMKFRKQPKYEFVRNIQSADIVINTYGIYFCNRFNKKFKGWLHTLKTVYSMFEPCVIAKIFGKRTVKFPASYGPITQKTDLVAAKLASRWIFDKIYAREKRSALELQKYSKEKNIQVSPDIANLVPFERDELSVPIIGIAVSSQIVRTWDEPEEYIACIVKSIQHIKKTYGAHVILYPNEIHINNPQNDMHLAKEIMTYFPQDDQVELFNSAVHSFYEQRNSISECTLMISSRYHSCVAALSAAVPTIVVGWHYKYNELMELYKQSYWIIADNDCSSDLLIKKLDQLWNGRQEVRHELEERSLFVKESIYEICRDIFPYQ